MKIKSPLLLALTAILALGGIYSALARTWTDAKTGRTLAGDLVSVKEGKVSVKRANGKAVSYTHLRAHET